MAKSSRSSSSRATPPAQPPKPASVHPPAYYSPQNFPDDLALPPFPPLATSMFRRKVEDLQAAVFRVAALSEVLSQSRNGNVSEGAVDTIGFILEEEIEALMEISERGVSWWTGPGAPSASS